MEAYMTPDEAIRKAEVFLAAKQNDQAIDVLRANDAPNDPTRCALLARAYFQRGDTKGDVYSSHFFARRAMELGHHSNRNLAILAVAAFRKELYGEAVEAFSRYVTESSPPGPRAARTLTELRARLVV